MLLITCAMLLIYSALLLICTVYISTLRVNLVCINVITRVNSLIQLFTSSNSRCLVGQLCVHDNGRPGAYSTIFYYGWESSRVTAKYSPKWVFTVFWVENFIDNNFKMTTSLVWMEKVLKYIKLKPYFQNLDSPGSYCDLKSRIASLHLYKRMWFSSHKTPWLLMTQVWETNVVVSSY